MPHVPNGDPNIKSMSIEGPMRDERYRVQGMTPEERAWRRQWIKDQSLTAREPVTIKDWNKIRHNPIRRFYKWPLDKLFQATIPTIGFDAANSLRYCTGKLIMGYIAFVGTYYYFKYNQKDWTTRNGWILRKGRPSVLPGDTDYDYPFVSNLKPSDYATEGFKQSPI